MEVIRKEMKLCLSCMEEHEVEIVTVPEEMLFKGEKVNFNATYEYCSNIDELSSTEEFLRKNGLTMKDAYRHKEGLLTASEIITIREKYRISQKEFSEVLDWGMATITRYENHQVQDRAHDDILRKINDDPKWFLSMLSRAKERITEKAYAEYHRSAMKQFQSKKNQYLVDYINAIYASYDDIIITGGVCLDLQKVVEMINYLALRVFSLHKVKLMKMLWYSDGLNFKRYGRSISGLAYCALTMGAVPVGHDEIVLLDGVSYDEVHYDENIGYKFKPTPDFIVRKLTKTDLEVIDVVIKELGELNTKEIVQKMHEEAAYKCTDNNCIISYSLAEQLSLQ